MATIWIPSLLRKFTDGATEITVAGETVREAIDMLDALHPGVKEQLVVDEKLKPNIALVIDGVTSKRGLQQELNQDSEVHFIPAIGGGNQDVRLLQKD
jgi:molybdopterin synthase sulfur carrier subunit